MSVRVEQRGAITIVTLDRPEARNAVDRPTADALSRAFREFADDPAQRVAVLTGAGGTFCAGADLKAIGGERGLVERLAAPGEGLAQQRPLRPRHAPVDDRRDAQEPQRHRGLRVVQLPERRQEGVRVADLHLAPVADALLHLGQQRQHVRVQVPRPHGRAPHGHQGHVAAALRQRDAVEHEAPELARRRRTHHAQPRLAHHQPRHDAVPERRHRHGHERQDRLQVAPQHRSPQRPPHQRLEDEVRDARLDLVEHRRDQELQLRRLARRVEAVVAVGSVRQLERGAGQRPGHRQTLRPLVVEQRQPRLRRQPVHRLQPVPVQVEDLQDRG
ncbi:MAG: hypothetical protein EOO75_15550, partial [Myxococcales bacterium]